MSNNKRFMVDTCGTLIDMETRDTFDYVSEVVDLLNRLVNEINTYDAGNQLLKRSFDECCKENEKLKHECNYLQNRLDDFINAQKENEQLKQQLNYIQNSISEHIKHQKTELGQKSLKKIIEDYNEWLLGHKRS